MLQDERVVVTPHIGGSTQESQVRVSLEIAGEVLTVLEGRSARFAVNAPLVSPTLASLLPPYIDLAERLGRFYIPWVGGPLDAIEIEYAGRLANEGTDMLTAAVIKGLLEPIHEDRVNLVNAQLVARTHGLQVSEHKTQNASRSENLIGLRGARRVVGTVLQNQPHIVQLDGSLVDVVASGYLLLTRHRDRPGMIGKVGRCSAMPISTSRRCRSRAARRAAIMVLSLDDAVPESVFEILHRELDLEWAKVLLL